MTKISYLIEDKEENIKTVALNNHFFNSNLKNINKMEYNQMKIFIQQVSRLADGEILDCTLKEIKDKEAQKDILIDVSRSMAEGTSETVSYKVLAMLGFNIGDSSSEGSPVQEVLDQIKEIKMKNRGVSINTHGNYKIEANTFGEYLASRFRMVRDDDNVIYAYDGGIYRVLKEIELRTICRDILNEVDGKLWKSRFQREYIEALEMEMETIDSLASTENKMAFNNGFLDLNTGKFHNFSPEYYFTNKLGYDYNPKALAPRFKRFLEEIFESDQERIKFIEELLGYLLEKDRRLHKMYIFKGTGSNGKSVLIDVIQGLLGVEKVSTTPLNKLEGRFGFQNFEDKLVNISSENELGNKNIDTANIKAITGGDRVEIERKNQDAYSIDIYTRLIASVNNDFSFTDTSYSILRRLLFIPFNVCFQDMPFDEKDIDLNTMYQDTGLLNDLLGELSGIFNIAYEGLLRLRSNNYVYTHSQVCQAELDRYIKYSDPITTFMEDELEVGENYENSVPEINKLFDSWQKNHGGDHKIINHTDAAKLVEAKMKALGKYTRRKRVNGENFLEGVRVKEVEIPKSESNITSIGQDVPAVG